MNQIDTLYELLQLSDTQYKVYDMGRRVQKLTTAEFKAFEDATTPYPYPLQQKAWLAILFWDKQRSEQQYLWFLSFQLDEQGKLIQATRNHFIAMVIEVLGTELTQQNNNQEKLDNNPYTFKPEQNKLAMLNAKIKVDLKQPASVYYEHALSYLKGEQGWDKWQSVGVQGLADFAARLATNDNQAQLARAIEHLPADVFNPLCAQLEHVDIGTHCTEQLVKLANAALANNDKQQLINCLRALSASKAAGLRQPLLEQILNQQLGQDSEVLLVITARCWHDLEQQNLRQGFLESLALCSANHGEQHQLFVGVVADLVAIPSVRNGFLHSFRQSDRSDTLAQAIGVLFGQHQR